MLWAGGFSFPSPFPNFSFPLPCKLFTSPQLSTVFLFQDGGLNIQWKYISTRPAKIRLHCRLTTCWNTQPIMFHDTFRSLTKQLPSHRLSFGTPPPQKKLYCVRVEFQQHQTDAEGKRQEDRRRKEEIEERRT